MKATGAKRLMTALLFVLPLLGTQYRVLSADYQVPSRAPSTRYSVLRTRYATPAVAQTSGRLYSETGFTLASQFVPYYDAHGGISLFGYPISEARIEEDAHGRPGYLVQWTERQRLEYHPENAGTPFEVLLGLLGRELTSGMDGPNWGVSANSEFIIHNSEFPKGKEVLFPETGHRVGEPFLSYWRNNGGLPIFGYPISSVMQDDKGLQVQWFERARFEYHPELAEPYKVLLGQLGVEAVKERDVATYRVEVSGNQGQGQGTPPGNGLQVGLAQGGETADPGFFDNVRAAGAALGPGLVRLDNIFSLYHIVGRAAEGTITYHWDDLDRVIDGVRAMGKEPLLCLSYMPETMSANSDSRVTPPAKYEEWGALVRATLAHLNVERDLGIRYLEVWNEPNEWDFWQGSYQDYLRLYDVTVEAALSVDPNVRVGGPALSRFSRGHLGELFEHEAALGPHARVDFISWHSYGQQEAELAHDIREAREIASQFPQFKPELFITEFNVLQGGQGDTSANDATDTVQGAIAFLSSVESMQRERLDRAFLFELKDGAGPKPFWGRWGVLTNDGQPKPIYYALRAYVSRPKGSLPVRVTHGPVDGTLGVLAFGALAPEGTPSKASLMLWYTGDVKAKIKIALPDSFSATEFDVTLFDASHNNPARSGDATLKTWMRRNAGDLVFELEPNSLALLASTE